MNWAPHDEQLRVWVTEEKLTASQIADRIGGVSRNAVIGRCHRIGLNLYRQPGENAKIPRPRARRSPDEGVRTINLRRKALDLPVTGFKPLQFAPLKPEPATPSNDPPIGPGRPLIDLPWNGCRFAVTEHETEQHLFCGAPKLTGHSYCAPHCLIAYAPPKKMMKLSEQERQRRRLQGLLNVQRGIYL